MWGERDACDVTRRDDVTYAARHKIAAHVTGDPPRAVSAVSAVSAAIGGHRM